MLSTCCDAEASYLSDDICGACKDHSDFYDENEDETCRNGKPWQYCDCC
tara:strand:- start:1524 stop:1670 length:147 start_codon:yes stop_codon:yes gene_type:complete